MSQVANSAKLELLNGNPNKRNTDELKRRAEVEEKLRMNTDKIEAPSWLDKIGKDTFLFIREELMSVELISNPDIYAIAMYANWYSEHVSLTRQYRRMRLRYKQKYKLEKEKAEILGESIDMDPELYGNPLSRQLDTCSRNMRSFGSDLGLSPSARAKLAIKLAQEGDDDDDDI